MQRTVYRRKDNCAGCPFKSRTCGNRGSRKARIAIVGESPGTSEIREGIPFIGPSGELLSRLLRTAGIDESDCYITNAISCLPPRSKDADGNSVKDQQINEAARACRLRLMKELTELPNLELIISMGSVALRTLSEAWGASIIKKRGQVIDHVLTPADYVDGEQLRGAGFPLSPNGILPTLHPAYILRSPAALPQLRSDLAKAERIISGKGFPQPTIEYRVLDTEEKIDTAIQGGLAKKAFFDGTFKRAATRNPIKVRVVADIETTGLDRFKDAFICIGFQFEHKISDGHNIVYVVTGRGKGRLVRYLFERMPKSVEWVWHNGKFDTSFLRAKGIPRAQCRVDHDTLLLSYTLDETGARHSLEQCIVDHLGLPAYKDMLGEYVGTGKKKKAYEDVPRTLLYEYMSKDVVFTGLLFQKLAPQVLGNDKKPHLEKAYLELLIPASNALATVELNGMPIDQAILEQSILELEDKIAPLLKKMSRVAGEDLNPNSPKQVLAALKARGLKNGKRHLLDTNKDTLKKLKGDALVDILSEYAKYRKLLSTYLVAFRKYGARVHTSYLIHGTVTGRLSCVASWTPIKTSNGTIPINSVRVGDSVWTHVGRWRQVTRTIIKGVDCMYDVHLSNGHILTCTRDHKLLTASGEWVSVGWLIDERFQGLGVQSGEPRGRSETLSILEPFDLGPNRGEVTHDISQRVLGSTQQYVCAREENISKVALLSFEDWQQESHEREVWNSPSELDWGVLGSQRVSHLPAQREETICSSSGNGKSTWSERVTKRVCRTPHRRQPIKQLVRQPSPGNKRGAQGYSLFAGRGLQSVEVEKINYRGRFEVYDITVDEDHSYEACGVISHNSSGPNMQNIPKEEIVRKHFRAPKGRVFVSFDYSQAELRSLAVLSGDKNLIDIFRSGKDMHAAVAADVYGVEFTREPEFLADGKTENPVYNKFRRNAKTVNFGIVYGATEFTLMERLGITWDEAHKLIKGWFAMFPDARKFMNECRLAPINGRPLITVFGRQRRFYVVTGQNRHGQENEAGNFPHQSMCSDFTLDSAIQIDRLAQKGPLPGRAFQINIIHDDNLFECDDNDEEVRKLVRLVRPIMEGTPIKHGITALPFKSDAKKGYVWSSMQKIAGV